MKFWAQGRRPQLKMVGVVDVQEAPRIEVPEKESGEGRAQIGGQGIGGRFASWSKGM